MNAADPNAWQQQQQVGNADDPNAWLLQPGQELGAVQQADLAPAAAALPAASKPVQVCPWGVSWGRKCHCLSPRACMWTAILNIREVNGRLSYGVAVTIVQGMPEYPVQSQHLVRGGVLISFFSFCCAEG
jgi:hypothetical protein